MSAAVIFNSPKIVSDLITTTSADSRQQFSCPGHFFKNIFKKLSWSQESYN